MPKTYDNIKAAEAVFWRCSLQKAFLEISQNWQENTGVRVFFLIKLQALGLRPATLLKKRLWHRCCQFCEISENTFFVRKPAVAASKADFLWF